MPTPRLHRPLALLALLALPAIATACGGAQPATKAGGGDIAPVTLDATSYGQQGRAAYDQLVEFAKQVDTLSGGAMTVKIGPPADNSRPDTSAEAIGMVRDGRAAVGVVSSRTFDLLGVNSLQALQAPFLITSQALADRVLDDPIAGDMLAGLDRIGLTGLGLVYDDLTVPVGFSAPLQSPQDFAGATITSRPSRAGDAVLKALGATPSPLNGGDAVDAATAGQLDGTVDALEQPTSPVNGTATGNAALYLKTNALVISKKVFDGLTAAQQDVLRQAATNTRAWWTTKRPDEASSVTAYCASGHGDVVVASDTDLAALQHATEPVVTAMEQDAATRKMITRIRALGADVTPPPLTACRAAGPAASTAVVAPFAAKGDQSVLDGHWRLVVDGKALEANGITGPDVGNNAGEWNFMFSDGKATGTEPHDVACRAAYVINGDRLFFNGVADTSCGGTFTVRFVRSGDRLTFTILDPGTSMGSTAFGEAFFKNALRRVGDVS